MKESLAAILFLLSMTAFVLLIVGFFKPTAALFWYKGTRTKKASALINGVIFFLALCISVTLMPDSPTTGDGSAPATAEKPAAASATGDPASGDASAGASTASSGDVSPKFDLVKVEDGPGFIECQVIMADRYRPETIVEEARQLKEQHPTSGTFRCQFYYKKLIDVLTTDASVEYTEDCKGCTVKDKDGTVVNFTSRWRKTQADSLLILHFDTTGFTHETAYLDFGEGTKHVIFSSNTSKALVVSLWSGDHEAKPFVKKKVDGQTRYYDPSLAGYYLVINDQTGTVEEYSNGNLNWQYLIEDGR